MIDAVSLISFKIDEEEFVIEIEKIKEICNLLFVTKVAKAPYFIEGIANLRGDILQIMNVHKILGLKNKPLSKNARLIVLDDKHTHAAIIVDAVNDVLQIEKEKVQEIPDYVAGNKVKFLKGIVKHSQERNILWLNAAALYSEFMAHNWEMT